MKIEKPYLMSDLTLDDLAGRISITPRYLSQLIRRSFNQNFFDYINTHRIEESKKLLTSEDDQKKTVLEILYDSGFNSKSAFNNAFKKYTGITPTEYRRHQATA
jgi:YesN/AraC family two-component response regulator